MDSLGNELNELIEANAAPKIARRKGNEEARVASAHKQILDMVAAANETALPARQVTPRAALTVFERAYADLSSLSDESRTAGAVREVSRFLSVNQVTSKAYDSSYAHTDLLVFGHPLAPETVLSSNDEVRRLSAEWVAADPAIADNARALVATAHSQAAGTIAREHAFLRLRALTAGAVPAHVMIDSLGVMALVAAGGNSSAARRARVALQLRDRKGRWVEMGRGLDFRFRMPDGSIATGHGTYIGAAGDTEMTTSASGKKELTATAAQVYVDNVPGLPRGIYTVSADNVESYKARIPGRKAPTPNTFEGQLDKSIPSVADLQATKADAPIGWKSARNGMSWVSDDGYEVILGQGKQPFSVRRTIWESPEASRNAETNRVRSWADVQDFISKDEPAYDAEVARIEGANPEPQLPVATLPDGAGDVLSPSEVQDMLRSRQAENDALDAAQGKPEELPANQDLNGNPIPDNWTRDANDPTDTNYTRELPRRDGGTYPIIARQMPDGRYIAGDRSGWIPEDGSEGRTTRYFDSLEEVNTAVPKLVDYLNGTFAKDNPIVPESSQPTTYGKSKAKRGVDIKPGDQVYHKNEWKTVKSVDGEGLNKRLVFEDGSYKVVGIRVEPQVKSPETPREMPRFGEGIDTMNPDGSAKTSVSLTTPDKLSPEVLQKLKRDVSRGVEDTDGGWFNRQGLLFNKEESLAGKKRIDVYVDDNMQDDIEPEKIASISDDGTISWTSEKQKSAWNDKMLRAIGQPRAKAAGTYTQEMFDRRSAGESIDSIAKELGVPREQARRMEMDFKRANESASKSTASDNTMPTPDDILKSLQDHLDESGTTESAAMAIADIQDKVKAGKKALETGNKNSAREYFEDAYNDLDNGYGEEGSFESSQAGAEAMAQLDELIQTLESATPTSQLDIANVDPELTPFGEDGNAFDYRGVGRLVWSKDSKAWMIRNGARDMVLGRAATLEEAKRRLDETIDEPKTEILDKPATPNSSVPTPDDILKSLQGHMDESGTTESAAMGIGNVQDDVKAGKKALEAGNKELAVSYFEDAYNALDNGYGDEGSFESSQAGAEAMDQLDKLIESLNAEQANVKPAAPESTDKGGSGTRDENGIEVPADSVTIATDQEGDAVIVRMPDGSWVQYDTEGGVSPWTDKQRKKLINDIKKERDTIWFDENGSMDYAEILKDDPEQANVKPATPSSNGSKDSADFSNRFQEVKDLAESEDATPKEFFDALFNGAEYRTPNAEDLKDYGIPEDAKVFFVDSQNRLVQHADGTWHNYDLDAPGESIGDEGTYEFFKDEFIEDTGDASIVFYHGAFIDRNLQDAVEEQRDSLYNDEGPDEPPSGPGGGGTPPKAPRPSAPSTPGLFEDFNVPDGAFQLRTVEYEPEGRIDEKSSNFTDDPRALANRFPLENLVSALSEALIGSNDESTVDDIMDFNFDDDGDIADFDSISGDLDEDAPRANVGAPSGAGRLEFNAGPEFVPAEALYNAIWHAGGDPNRVIANIYDAANGNRDNLNRLVNAQGGVPSKEEAELIDDITEQISQIKKAAPDEEKSPANKSEKPEEKLQPLIDNVPVYFSDPVLYTLDTNPYDPGIPTPDENGFTDNPELLARYFYTADLIDQLTEAITDGSGFGTFDFGSPDGETRMVQVEAIRDALQHQGVNTNEILINIEKSSSAEEPKKISRDDVRWDAAQGLYTDVNGKPLDGDTVDALGLDSSGRDTPAADIQQLNPEASSKPEQKKAPQRMEYTFDFVFDPEANANNIDSWLAENDLSTDISVRSVTTNGDSTEVSFEFINDTPEVRDRFAFAYTGDSNWNDLIGDFGDTGRPITDEPATPSTPSNDFTPFSDLIDEYPGDANVPNERVIKALDKVSNDIADKSTEGLDNVRFIAFDSNTGDIAVDTPAGIQIYTENNGVFNVGENRDAQWFATEGANRGWEPVPGEVADAIRARNAEKYPNASTEEPSAPTPEPAAPETPPAPTYPYPGPRERGYTANNTTMDYRGNVIGAGARVKALRDNQLGTVVSIQNDPEYVRIKLDNGKTVVRSANQIYLAGGAAPEAPAAPVRPVREDLQPVTDVTERLSGPRPNPVIARDGRTPGVNDRNANVPDEYKDLVLDEDAVQSDFSEWGTRDAEIAKAARERIAMDELHNQVYKWLEIYYDPTTTDREKKQAYEKAQAMFRDAFGQRDGLSFGAEFFTLDLRGVSIGATYGNGPATLEQIQKRERAYSVTISGRILDKDGRDVGSVERNMIVTPSKDVDGNITYDVVPENKILRVNSTNKKLGFASAYNRYMENWYIANGVKQVKVHAYSNGSPDWQGGFVWALNGFGWDPKNMGYATNALDVIGRSAETDEEKEIVKKLKKRLSDSYDPATQTYDLSKAPTPMELALIGWYPGAKTWAGRKGLLKTHWYGVKNLNPTAIEQKQAANYRALKAAEVRAKAGQNKPQPSQQFLSLLNSDEFQSDPIAQATLGSHMDAVRDVLKNNRSLAILSPDAKAALSNYVSKNLYNPNSKVPLDDLMRVRTGLMAEYRADFAVPDAFAGAGYKLTGYDRGAFADAARGGVGSALDEAGFDVEEFGDGGINPTYLVTHRDSGQTFFVKSEEHRDSWGLEGRGLTPEVEASYLFNTLGMIGAYQTRASTEDPDLIIMSTAGADLPLVRTPMQADTANVHGLYLNDGTKVNLFNSDAFAEGIKNPEDIYRMLIADTLLGNEDRHGGNWLLAIDRTDNKAVIFPIDHTLADMPVDNDQALDAMNDYIARINGMDYIYERFLPKIIKKMGRDRALQVFKNEVKRSLDNLDNELYQPREQELAAIIEKWGSYDAFKDAMRKRLNDMIDPNSRLGATVMRVFANIQ